MKRCQNGFGSKPPPTSRANPGSAPVPGAGESVPLSRTSKPEIERQSSTAIELDGVRYAKRRLPHFEKPWMIYAITTATRQRRKLSAEGRMLVLTAVRHFNLSRYELFAVCVMPDHVHILLQPWPKDQDCEGKPIFWSISELAHSLKSFTAHKINKLEKSAGAVWEEEVFDRYIRSEADLHEKFCYICKNPWQSGLVAPGEEYEWIWTPEGNDPFRRDAETHARDGRAPQSPREARALPGSRTVDRVAANKPLPQQTP